MSMHLSFIYIYKRKDI